MTRIFELDARYDARQSFYGKAHVIENEDGSLDLLSYETIVAHVDKDGHYTSEGLFSQTTSRHQREFRKQFARD